MPGEASGQTCSPGFGSLWCSRMSAASPENLNQDLQFATELARDAGKIVLDYWGKVERLTKTHSMTTSEAVTDADRASQRSIVAGLRRRVPNDGIVGEENDTRSAHTLG